MSGLMPFFTYYGGKWRVAPKYPTPVGNRIVEPFAGSAGYSLRYPDREVILNDLDPIICGTWDYLINASKRDILSLPDLGPGDTVDDFGLCQEAKWLIGWWLNKGSAQPKRSPSTFMLKHPAGGPYWGASIRARIASQLEAIRHWEVSDADYQNLPDVEGTWFVDPPYQKAGGHYRYGNKAMDYDALAAWCQDRKGQVIVCEADDATWLPFQHLAAIDGTEGKQKTTRARVEVFWTKEASVSEVRDPETDQSLPVPNDNAYIHDLVTADLQARKELGIRKYGTALQADNGRSMLLDAYHEALDLAVYLRGALEEQENT